MFTLVDVELDGASDSTNGTNGTDRNTRITHLRNRSDDAYLPHQSPAAEYS